MGYRDTVLEKAYELYQAEGRNVFTATELAMRSHLEQTPVIVVMKRAAVKGYVKVHEAFFVCGTLKCPSKELMYSLTKAGIEYVTGKEIDYEPTTDTYLLSNNEKDNDTTAVLLTEEVITL